MRSESLRLKDVKLTKKIYVGNLSYQATEDEVRDMFSEYGTVESIAMISDRETGRFRGFCFVEMPDGDADAAIAALDGKEIGGRNLRVNEARPKDARPGGGGPHGSSSGGRRGGSGNRGRRDDFGGGGRW